MAKKQKHANLIFKTGQMVTIPVQEEVWPKVLEYQIAQTKVTFTYVGVQYGVGAYVEQGAG